MYSGCNDAVQKMVIPRNEEKKRNNEVLSFLTAKSMKEDVLKDIKLVLIT
jgi:hypothetical protein